ncbi:CBS domain-containing protein [Candidatus Woesearchaeota archaeon]|nr:CBS domain-containing protein [Candidatus Woesearchaeota archaeon]
MSGTVDTAKVKELEDYIKKCISMDIDDKKIIETLVKVGWSGDMIRIAINKLQEDNSKKKSDEPRHHEKRRLSHRAEDIMNKKTITVNKNTKLIKVIELLKKKESGYVLVVEGFKPLGIITETDILMNINKEGKLDLKVSCEEIMCSPLYFCEHDETLLDVCEKMNINKIESIPVLKKGRLVGIITSSLLIDFMSYHG